MVELHYAAVLRKGQMHCENKEYMQAQTIAEMLLARNKKDVNALLLLGLVHKGKTRFSEAIACFEKCIALDPKTPDHYLNLGTVLSLLGRTKLAIARFEKARKLRPDDPRIIVAVVDAYEKAGEKDKALELLDPFIQAGADDVHMAFNYANIKVSQKEPEKAIAALLRHVHEPMVPPSFFFVLGKAYEATGDFDRAFHAYSAGNVTNSGDFDLEKHIQLIDDMIEVFNPANLARLPQAKHGSKKPVFVVGRPRSGTTLIESILDAHPQIAGIGEDSMIANIASDLGFTIGSTLSYPKSVGDMDQGDVERLGAMYLEHIDMLGKNATRVVDKSLANYLNLGLIQLLFPLATVIHCRRNAIDNCWGCFVENLHEHKYTTDLHNLGITHRHYERLMRHWHKVLDLSILDIDYEEVVADQEGMSRKIIEFCGLPWDDRCLRFYESSAQRNVKAAITLSYDQVRRPIYKTSVGRAKKFEQHLGPLFEALAEGQAQVEAKERASCLSPSLEGGGEGVGEA